MSPEDQLVIPFPVPAHETLVDRLHIAAREEVAFSTAQAQVATSRQFDSLQVFTRRSIGQQRRHFYSKRGIKP